MAAQMRPLIEQFVEYLRELFAQAARALEPVVAALSNLYDQFEPLLSPPPPRNNHGPARRMRPPKTVNPGHGWNMAHR